MNSKEKSERSGKRPRVASAKKEDEKKAGIRSNRNEEKPTFRKKYERKPHTDRFSESEGEDFGTPYFEEEGERRSYERKPRFEGDSERRKPGRPRREDGEYSRPRRDDDKGERRSYERKPRFEGDSERRKPGRPRREDGEYSRPRRDDDKGERRSYERKPRFEGDSERRKPGRPRREDGEYSRPRREDDKGERRSYERKPRFEGDGERRKPGRPRREDGEYSRPRRDDDKGERRSYERKPRFEGDSERRKPGRPRREDGEYSRPRREDDKGERRSYERKPRFEGDSERRKPGRPRREDGEYSRPRREDDKGEKRSYERKPRFEDKPRRTGRRREESSFSKTYERTPSATGLIRLNKYLADSGVCSRREADDLIIAGTVKVNGVVVNELGTKVKPTDVVVYDGRTLKREKLRYLLLNKPKGYITTSDDPFDRQTVMDLVADACDERLYPVGRLDRNTVGLLLMTNDGDLAKAMTHPKYGVKKLYHVTLDKPLTKNDLLKIAEGFELEDGMIDVDSISWVSEQPSKKEVGIEIHSGKNRIVRRIFEHLGYEVVKLDRVMLAGLTKVGIERGHWRFLTDTEVSILKKIK